MKETTGIITAAVCLLSACPQVIMAHGLWESFLNPSPEARTKVWWFHGETETTKEGIRDNLYLPPYGSVFIVAR